MSSMRRKLVLLFKIGFFSVWVIMIFVMSLWTNLAPIGAASTALSVFKPVISSSLNSDLSNNQERDIQRLKTAGFVPRDMSVDVWVFTNDDGDENSGYSLPTAPDKCVIFIGVSPSGRAWASERDALGKAHEEPLSDMLTQEVLHEVAHCVLDSYTAFDRHGDDITGRDKANVEKFADIYGLTMSAFINQDISRTIEIGKHVSSEREATAKNVKYASSEPVFDKYDTSYALTKMIGWIQEIKTIPDAKSAFRNAIEFSGVTSFHHSSPLQHTDSSL